MDACTHINQGIRQTGGEIRAHNTGEGENVSITETGSTENAAIRARSLPEVRERLNELEKVLKLHADSLENHDEIVDSANKVAEELHRDKPNKLTITAILNGIAEGVKSVTGIATAVEALKRAVAAML
jgi:hypothetical protein